MENNKSLTLEKEVLFGDIKKNPKPNPTKKNVISAAVFSLILTLVFEIIGIYFFSEAIDYVEIKDNVIFNIEKYIIYLFLIICLLFTFFASIKSIISVNNNVPIPIIQEKSYPLLVLLLGSMVFTMDVLFWGSLKNLHILDPFLNLNLILFLGLLSFIFGMLIEKNRIKKLKIDKSKPATFGYAVGITFVISGYVRFTSKLYGWSTIYIIIGLIEQCLLLYAGQLVMLRRERKKFLRENNLNLLDVRNEMLGINQNEENVSY